MTRRRLIPGRTCPPALEPQVTNGPRQQAEGAQTPPPCLPGLPGTPAAAKALQPSRRPLVTGAPAQWRGQPCPPRAAARVCTCAHTHPRARLPLRPHSTDAHAPPRPHAQLPKTGLRGAGGRRQDAPMFSRVFPWGPTFHTRPPTPAGGRLLRTHQALPPAPNAGWTPALCSVPNRGWVCTRSPTGATAGVHALSPRARAAHPRWGTDSTVGEGVAKEGGEVWDSGRGAGAGVSSQPHPNLPGLGFSDHTWRRPHSAGRGWGRTGHPAGCGERGSGLLGVGRAAPEGLGAQEVRRGPPWAAPGP